MITLAADVGGTFTDLILTIGAGSGWPAATHVDKVSTGARGSTAGIEAGIAKITQAAGLSVGDVDLFVHGFTVGINALLTRAGARAALIVPQGQGDVLEIGNQIRPRTYALFQDKPVPVIPKTQVIEIAEGIDAFGTVTRGLTQAAIMGCLDDIDRLKPEAVAISLSFSFLNPRHEQALAEGVRSRFPDLPIFLFNYKLGEFILGQSGRSNVGDIFQTNQSFTEKLASSGGQFLLTLFFGCLLSATVFATITYFVSYRLVHQRYHRRQTRRKR